jgi:hypothetical protein
MLIRFDCNNAIQKQFEESIQKQQDGNFYLLGGMGKNSQSEPLFQFQIENGKFYCVKSQLCFSWPEHLILFRSTEKTERGNEGGAIFSLAPCRFQIKEKIAILVMGYQIRPRRNRGVFRAMEEDGELIKTRCRRAGLYGGQLYWYAIPAAGVDSELAIHEFLKALL